MGDNDYIEGFVTETHKPVVVYKKYIVTRRRKNILRGDSIMTEADEKAIVDLSNGGASAPKISQVTGWELTSVHHVIRKHREANLAKKPEPSPKVKTIFLVGRNDIQWVLDLKAAGHDLEAICDITKWSPTTIRKILREHTPKPPEEVKPEKPFVHPTVNLDMMGNCRYYLGKRFEDYRMGTLWLDGNPASLREVKRAAYAESVKRGQPIDLTHRAWRDIE